MNSNKIKLLDNYQLFLLIRNTSIDEETRAKLQSEFKNRDISNDVELRLNQKYGSTHPKQQQVIDVNNWDPILTGFAINRHFKQIALLKVAGNTREAKNYQLRLYAGIAIYFLLFIIALLLLKL